MPSGSPCGTAWRHTADPGRDRGDLLEVHSDHRGCLTGDPANTDPSLEVLTKLFDSRAECEQAKTKSTGEGQGEIEGKKVLRIVGRCQELTPNEVQQLKDALSR